MLDGAAFNPINVLTGPILTWPAFVPIAINPVPGSKLPAFVPRRISPFCVEILAIDSTPIFWMFLMYTNILETSLLYKKKLKIII